MKRAKSGEFRLMGFGHRVYKNYDPRATVLKPMAEQVLEVTGRSPLLDLAMELERIALEDDYFISPHFMADPRPVGGSLFGLP